MTQQKVRLGRLSTLKHRLVIMSVYGPVTSFNIAISRLFGWSGVSSCFNIIKPLVKGKVGLEIGGPSPFFCKDAILPIYHIAKRIDDCKFRRDTLWSSDYNIEKKEISLRRGRKMILDATDLRGIKTGSYDFLLSCHSIEHIANPIKALYE